MSDFSANVKIKCKSDYVTSISEAKFLCDKYHQLFEQAPTLWDSNERWWKK